MLTLPGPRREAWSGASLRPRYVTGRWEEGGLLRSGYGFTRARRSWDTSKGSLRSTNPQTSSMRIVA